MITPVNAGHLLLTISIGTISIAQQANAGGQKETKWFFGFTFRGMGSVSNQNPRKMNRFIHRSFQPLNPSEDYLRNQARRRRSIQ